MCVCVVRQLRPESAVRKVACLRLLGGDSDSITNTQDSHFCWLKQVTSSPPGNRDFWSDGLSLTLNAVIIPHFLPLCSYFFTVSPSYIHPFTSGCSVAVFCLLCLFLFLYSSRLFDLSYGRGWAGGLSLVYYEYPFVPAVACPPLLAARRLTCSFKVCAFTAFHRLCPAITFCRLFADPLRLGWRGCAGWSSSTPWRKRRLFASCRPGAREHPLVRFSSQPIYTYMHICCFGALLTCLQVRSHSLRHRHSSDFTMSLELRCSGIMLEMSPPIRLPYG